MRSKVAISLAAMSLLLLAACGPAATVEPTAEPTPTTAATDTPAATETAEATETTSAACDPGDPAAANVFISGFAFSPASLTVPVGTTVTWLNQDAVGHTATADDGSFDCRPLGSSASLATTFQTAGTFEYFCAIHPTMRGVIVVQ